jgi:hypothetical protein
MDPANSKVFPVDPKHNFIAKLRQASLWPKVESYIAWQKAVRLARAEGAPEPQMPDFGPISINLDLTTACNFRCGHCIDWDILNGKAKYTHQKLLASLENMIGLGLRSVILIGGGEPTLYPGFGDVVRFLKERQIQMAVVSNGSRSGAILNVAHLLVEKDWVRLSLDSGSSDTFQRMHRPTNGVSLEGICSGVPRIRERNSKIAVGFSFVIIWEGSRRDGGVDVIPNIHEIVMATKLAREYKFSYISFKPFLTRFPGGGEVMDSQAMENEVNVMTRIRDAINEARKYETESFKVIESINLGVLERGVWRDFTNQSPTCHIQAFRQVLSPLGLFNCPAYRGAPKAKIAGPEAYGDNVVATQTAIGSILKRFNATHECGEITCLYNPINWWLENAINSSAVPSDITALPDKNDYFL